VQVSRVLNYDLPETASLAKRRSGALRKSNVNNELYLQKGPSPAKLVGVIPRGGSMSLRVDRVERTPNSCDKGGVRLKYVIM